MTQNNIYMENDELQLFADVQPVLLYELERNKNAAVESAVIAKQSEEKAQTLMENVLLYKTNIETFYANAMNNLTDLFNDLVSASNNNKNSISEYLQTLKNSIISNINNFANTIKTSIQTLGQDYVNQAKGYAESAEDIVENRLGKNYLNQYKGLETGSVSTNLNVLNDIKNYAHSTFDKSKFTIVGSPVITDDGIASGFSGSNYISKAITLTNDNDITIKFRYKYSAIQTATDRVILNFNDWPTAFGFYGNGGLYYGWAGKGGTVAIGSNIDTYIDVIMEYKKNTSVVCKAKTVTSDTWITSQTYDMTDITFSYSSFYIGKMKTQGMPFTNGTVDLKYFEIDVDGVPVFSGNKTGIDTIKTDNYTEVGTVTFTPDGIASFPANSQLKYDFSSSISGASHTVIEGEIFFKDENINALCLANSSNAHMMLMLGFMGSSYSAKPNSLLLYYPVGASSRNYITSNSNLLVANTKYYYKIDLNDYKLNIYLGTNKSNLSRIFGPNYPTIYDGSTFNWFTLNGVRGDVPTSDKTSEMDLNEYKVYVDGDLVYQPCLKIPFTESAPQYGSKIVNSIYRNRVQDAYEQGYSQRYYTLDEENGNFTLPMGELYGMIENLRKLILERTES